MPDSLEELVGGLGWLVLVVVAVWGAAKLAVKASIEKAVEKKFREWEVRFSVLHQHRIEVMEGLRDRLVTVKSDLDAASSPQRPEEADQGRHHLEKAFLGIGEARRYLDRRSFYLPKTTREKVDRVLKEAKEAWASIITGAEGWHHQPSGPGSEVNAKLLKEGFESIRKTLPPLIEEVDEEFRRLVGGG